MAGHRLIDASITALARRLPAGAVDELADGLTETYQRHLSNGLDPDAAAGAAIAEFGDPDLVIAAFVRQSPGRRLARALLGSGPAVGGCWGAALITGHAWTWPVPLPARLAFGLALLAVVTALALAATTRRSLRLTRLTTVSGLGLVALDAAALACVALVPPAFSWPLAAAVLASLARVTLTIRTLPRLPTG
jgi:hypothetical protein